MRKKIIMICCAVAMLVQISGCARLDAMKSFVKSNIDQTINQIKNLSATEAPAPESTVSAQEAEVTNSLSLGVTDIDTWNPILTQSEMVREAMQLVYEPLFEINENMEAVPVLANDYSISPDGKTIEVNLREGILWHDGSSFDSYDVEYTVNQLRLNSTVYSSMVSDISECRAMGNNRVRFVLKRSVPDFVSLLTFPIIKYQTPMNVTLNYTPVGTGPYYYYGKTGTDEYMLYAFDSYHNGRAVVDSINILKIPDVNKCYSMFEASEIDFITSKMVDITTEMPRGNVKTYDYTSNRMTYLGFNLQSENLSGAATRIAVSNLINKEKLASTKLYSRVVPVDIPFNPSSYVYYDASPVLRDEYEKTNEYLKKDNWEYDGKRYTRTVNGVSKTLTLKLLVNSDNYQKMQTASQLEEDLEKHGIEVTVEALSYNLYAARVEAHDFDMFIGETEIGANQDLTPLTGYGNYFSYSNADVDTIISHIGMTGDAEQKKQLFIQLGTKLTEDMPFTPLYYAKESVICGAKLKTELKPTVSGFYRQANTWSVK